MLATLHKGLRRHSWRALTLLLALALVGVVFFRFASGAHAKPRTTYRTTRRSRRRWACVQPGGRGRRHRPGGAALHRAGRAEGLAFQSDTAHRVLRSERNGKVAWRAALMRQGHELPRADLLPAVPEQPGRGSARRQDNHRGGGPALQHVPVR